MMELQNKLYCANKIFLTHIFVFLLFVITFLNLFLVTPATAAVSCDFPDNTINGIAVNLTADTCNVTNLPTNDEALFVQFNPATDEVIIAVSTDIPSVGLGVNTLSINGTPQTVVSGTNAFPDTLADDTTITLTGTHNGNSENFSYTVNRSGGTVTLAGSSSGGVPAAISVTSGNNQSTEFSTAFTNPLVVTVTDSGGNPVASETVTFTAPTTGASLSSVTQTATTNASGVASLSATANAASGSYVVEASVSGVATTADFSLSNTTGPSSIVVTSGNNQSTEISSNFTDPLVVTVTDSGGNPVASETVTFTAPTTGASLSSVTQTATTNASGVASLSATANAASGSYVVEASVSGVATTADFSLSNTTGPSSIVVTSGNNQSTEISSNFTDPLVVTVTDAGGNPVANETITFSAPSSGASLTVVTQTATTNAAGVASLSAAANSIAGSYVVAASVSGIGTSADFSLTNARDSNADIARTKAVIGAFVGTRANQIVAEQPRLVQRLRTGKFGQQKGLNSFFYDVSSSRQQASFQFSYASFMNKLTSLNTNNSSHAATRIANGFDQMEPPKQNLKLGWAADAIATPHEASSAISSLVSDSGISDDSYSPSGFDIWAQGSYIRVENNDFGSNNGLFFVGVDYRYEDELLVGFLTQLDISEEDNNTANTSASGVGWMFGPYAVLRLQPNLYMNGQATYGRSSNDVDALGLGTDNFDTERLLLQAGLTGDFSLNEMTLNPFANLTYYYEKQEAYIDQLGNTISDQTFTLGRLEFGPRVSYDYLGETGYLFSPFLSVSGIYDFNRLVNAIPTDATLASADENFRARVEGGAELVMPSPGIRVLGEGFYDGIGVSDYEAYGGKLSANIQF
ncbi:Bacterial Ig-like domain (group 1) [Pseudovibrio sp. Ad37]|nr:Bacterial Ig-like domain (group 1) [Pseudovibrio sp. Ad37]